MLFLSILLAIHQPSVESDRKRGGKDDMQQKSPARLKPGVLHGLRSKPLGHQGLPWPSVFLAKETKEILI